jgi:GNAT superfamily N-acetyltransferase
MVARSEPVDQEESMAMDCDASNGMNSLRRLKASDHEAVLEVYREAVISGAGSLYTPLQCQAWAQQAMAGQGIEALRRSLQRGWGLVSCSSPTRIEAFGLLDPCDRLALLYCRPQAGRQGRASALLQALEAEAQRRGIGRLRTEASFLSHPLLLRCGWQVRWQEELLINGVLFRRFRMDKVLAPGTAILN